MFPKASHWVNTFPVSLDQPKLCRLFPAVASSLAAAAALLKPRCGLSTALSSGWYTAFRWPPSERVGLIICLGNCIQFYLEWYRVGPEYDSLNTRQSSYCTTNCSSSLWYESSDCFPFGTYTHQSECIHLQTSGSMWSGSHYNADSIV